MNRNRLQNILAAHFPNIPPENLEDLRQVFAGLSGRRFRPVPTERDPRPRLRAPGQVYEYAAMRGYGNLRNFRLGGRLIRDLDYTLLYSDNRLYSLYSPNFRRRYSQIGFTDSQIRILSNLSGNPRYDRQYIATNDPPGSITRIARNAPSTSNFNRRLTHTLSDPDDAGLSVPPPAPDPAPPVPAPAPIVDAGSGVETSGVPEPDEGVEISTPEPDEGPDEEPAPPTPDPEGPLPGESLNDFLLRTFPVLIIELADRFEISLFDFIRALTTGENIAVNVVSFQLLDSLLNFLQQNSFELSYTVMGFTREVTVLSPVNNTEYNREYGGAFILRSIYLALEAGVSYTRAEIIDRVENSDNTADPNDGTYHNIIINFFPAEVDLTGLGFGFEEFETSDVFCPSSGNCFNKVVERIFRECGHDSDSSVWKNVVDELRDKNVFSLLPWLNGILRDGSSSVMNFRRMGDRKLSCNAFDIVIVQTQEEKHVIWLKNDLPDELLIDLLLSHYEPDPTKFGNMKFVQKKNFNLTPLRFSCIKASGMMAFFDLETFQNTTFGFT